MKLFRLELALKLAEAVWQGNLRVRIGDTVAELSGSGSAGRACGLYGHLPVKELKEEDGRPCVRLCEYPESAGGVWQSEAVAIGRSEGELLAAALVPDEGAAFVYRVKGEEPPESGTLLLPDGAEEMRVLPLWDVKGEPLVICMDLLQRLYGNAIKEKGGQKYGPAIPASVLQRETAETRAVG